MRIVCISDTHGLHDELLVPEGDILVHAGDFSQRGTVPQVSAFAAWLAAQPHAVKIVVAGNHDFLFQEQPSLAREILGDVVYLEHEAAEVQGLRIFGSPWQPWFRDWAWNLPRGEELARKWRQVPAGLDLFVTHTPPHGTLDTTRHDLIVGCEALAEELPRIAPRLHVFGHIHEARGVATTPSGLVVNASNCDVRNRLVFGATVIELDDAGARVVTA